MASGSWGKLFYRMMLIKACGIIYMEICGIIYISIVLHAFLLSIEAFLKNRKQALHIASL